MVRQNLTHGSCGRTEKVTPIRDSAEEIALRQFQKSLVYYRGGLELTIGPLRRMSRPEMRRSLSYTSWNRRSLALVSPVWIADNSDGSLSESGILISVTAAEQESKVAIIRLYIMDNS